MASAEELILDLDSETEQKASMVKKTNGKTASRRSRPVTKNKKPARDETEDDDADADADQPAPTVKQEKSGSSISDDDSPKKRKTPGRGSGKPPTEIVAIDFGMWGCGISSGQQRGLPGNVKARKTWPKNEGSETSKFPAITALPEDNDGHENFIGRDEPYTAFEVLNGMKAIAYPKQVMAREISPSPLDDRILQEDIAKKLLRPSEPAKYRKAMIEILKYIRKIHKEGVARSLGRELQPDDSFHYVFTHPAACSEAGRRTLREAVKAAGFEDRSRDRVTYLSEAHAAASAAFIDARATMNDQDFGKVFKKNKKVTVIDCGALTVDATTIVVLGTDSKLRIAEACVSNGGNCGTTAIMSRFLKAFEDKFGADFSAVPPEQLDRGTNFYKDGETILRTYDGTSQGGKHKFSLKMPDDFTHPDYNARTGEAFLHDAEIKRAFDENLEYIKAIVRDQWQKDCKKTDVIATGGGSLCPYIDKVLETFCKDHGVRYVRLSNSDSAVCRGALINAMNENFFGWRLSRAYFGIPVRKKGRTQIKWFITRGQQINVKKGITVKKCPGKLKLNNDILRSILEGMDRQRPHFPIYTFQGHLEEGQAPPKQSTDIGVEKVGGIGINGSDFSNTFRNTLQRGLRSGKTISIDAAVSVTVDDSGRLFFDARSGKIRLGQGELRYDSTEIDPQPPSW